MTTHPFDVPMDKLRVAYVRTRGSCRDLVAVHGALRARLLAEREFHSSVAVTADGTDVLTSQLVAVAPLESDGEILLYPAAAFRPRRVLMREPHNPYGRAGLQFYIYTYRVQVRRTCEEASLPYDTSVESFVRALVISRRRDRKRDDYLQCKIHVNRNVIPGLDSLLIVQPKDCPSPLPEGGHKLG